VEFPAWSISVEWWTYFTLFPLLVYFGPRLTNRQALALRP
jgi:peptidoglycan/LPS O-acetylase OafA/YrhL